MRIPEPHIVEEVLKRERPRVHEERVHVPQAPPEYLRWVEETLRREKEESEKENQGDVVIFQM